MEWRSLYPLHQRTPPAIPVSLLVRLSLGLKRGAFTTSQYSRIKGAIDYYTVQYS
jgi:hypothetical protein